MDKPFIGKWRQIVTKNLSLLSLRFKPTATNVCAFYLNPKCIKVQRWPKRHNRLYKRKCEIRERRYKDMGGREKDEPSLFLYCKILRTLTDVFNCIIISASLLVAVGSRWVERRWSWVLAAGWWQNQLLRRYAASSSNKCAAHACCKRHVINGFLTR